MEGIITDLDREIHRRKTHFLIERLREGGAWEYEVNNGNTYVFKLKDGTELSVLEYGIDKKVDKHYDQYKVLLAKINDVVVGFLSIGIYDLRPERQSAVSESNVGVIIKGKGIGGRLDAVKNYLLQQEANIQGDLFDLGDDENSSIIKTELEGISEQYGFDKDREKYLKKLHELIMKRQYWLALYGREGRSGYEHHGTNVDGKSTFSKKFIKGNPPTELNCKIEKNETNIKEEVKKIRW